MKDKVIFEDEEVRIVLRHYQVCSCNGKPYKVPYLVAQRLNWSAELLNKVKWEDHSPRDSDRLINQVFSELIDKNKVKLI